MKKIKNKESWQRVVVWVDHEDWTDDDADAAGAAVVAAHPDLNVRGFAISEYGAYREVRKFDLPPGHSYDEETTSLPAVILIDLPGSSSDGSVQSAIDDVVEAITPLVIDRCQLQPGEDDVIKYEVWRSIAAGTLAPLGVLDRLAAIPTDEATS